MKKMKKLASILLAAIMVLAMAVPAMAEETITINETGKNHTYLVYQIFTGDLSKEVLSNIRWGKGITPAGQAKLYEYYEVPTIEKDGEDQHLRLEKLAEAIAEKDNAAELADVLMSNASYLTTDESNITKITYSDGYSTTVEEKGYYLIIDSETDDPIGATDDAYSSYIVEVVGEANVTPKSTTPEVDKFVFDNADSSATSGDGFDVGGNTNGWFKTADHQINETFQFKLEAELKADKNYADYEHYKLVFHDKMSAGVTYEEVATIKITGVNSKDETPLEVSIDPKNLEDKASIENKLNEDGTTTLTITINDLVALGFKLEKGVKAEVVYNAHLNEKAVLGDQDDNINDVYLEYSNSPNSEGTGQTPEKTVFVFTYDVSAKKVDGKDKITPLPDARFKLYTDNTLTKEIKLALDLTDGYYYPIADQIGGEGVEMAPNVASGVFKIKGLDAGSYVLSETKVPDGYNKCDDIQVNIAATEHATDPDGAHTTFTAPDKDFLIVNNAGATLPETGGIGTTIFYVLGSILVLGAVILLVTKRRMGAEK